MRLFESVLTFDPPPGKDSFTIWDFVQQQLADNQFLSGGAALMALGAAMATLRSLPSRLWDQIQRRMVTSVTIDDNDWMFNYFRDWIGAHPYCSRSRDVVASLKFPDGDDEDWDVEVDRGRPKVKYSPAPGFHWFWWKRLLIFIYRERVTRDQQSGQRGYHETFYLTFFTRNRRRIDALFAEAIDRNHPPGDRRVTVMIPDGQSWSTMDWRPRRSLDTVLCAAGLVEDFFGDLKSFLKKRSWYESTGVPYRRGYLFYYAGMDVSRL
ncbi:MAG: BCS1 and AAA domain-containing protein [Planctomycetia bacterium]